MRTFLIILTLTKNGIIRIINALITLGLFIGESIKFFTPSQKFNCMNNVIQVFTIAINPMYNVHCTNHIYIDGGLPMKNFKLYDVKKMIFITNYHIHQN